MANAVEKLNTIAIADIEKVNTLTDSNIEDINTLEFAGYSVTHPSWAGARAVTYGGTNHTDDGYAIDSADYILYKTIASDGNAATFDRAQSGRHAGKGSGSNGTRALWGGGWSTVSGSGTLGVEQIDYVTVASTESANDFGNLDAPSGYGGYDGASNGTSCFFNGGRSSAGGYHNDMEYVTIGSTGNGTDAGNLEDSQSYHSTSNGDSKYLIMGGRTGSSSTKLNTVSQNSFSTSANATDFGAVGTFAMYGSAIACSTTRVVVAGTSFSADGSTFRGDDIHYFSPASAADSVDDGYSIHIALWWMSGTSDGTTGEFFGGEENGTSISQARIDKITIASLADATDAGDLAHPTSIEFSTYSVAGGMNRVASQSGT